MILKIQRNSVCSLYKTCFFFEDFADDLTRFNDSNSLEYSWEMLGCGCLSAAIRDSILSTSLILASSYSMCRALTFHSNFESDCELTVRVTLMITQARGKRSLIACPLPHRQPSVSLRESLLSTALQTR